MASMKNMVEGFNDFDVHKIGTFTIADFQKIA